MSWQKSVAKFDKVHDFGGGTKSQREHLNEIVDVVNRIIQEAQANPDGADASKQLLYVNENGVAVKYIFHAQKAQLT